MNNLSYHVSRAQFLYDFQIFGTKMFVRALPFQKYTYISFLDGVSETKDSEKGPNLNKRENYGFSWFFMIFGHINQTLNFHVYFFSIDKAFPNILVPNIWKSNKN